MKKILIVLSLFIFSKVNSQVNFTVDTVIVNKAYTSYFSYTLKEPLYVIYDLYKGGGDCDRSVFHFKNRFKLEAKPKDYAKSHYEEGHLANAEDFAFDCFLDSLTFEFYNCLPQTLKLNRGIWKKWETSIREESQLNHLRIICGGVFTNHKIGPDSIYVPDYCWKIVINLDDNSIKHILWFPNDNSDSVEELTNMDDLSKKIIYQLPKLF